MPRSRGSSRPSSAAPTSCIGGGRLRGRARRRLRPVADTASAGPRSLDCVRKERARIAGWPSWGNRRSKGEAHARELADTEQSRSVPSALRRCERGGVDSRCRSRRPSVQVDGNRGAVLSASPLLVGFRRNKSIKSRCECLFSRCRCFVRLSK